MFSLGGPLSSTFLLDHQWLSLHSIENLFDNQDLEGVEYYIQKSTALVGEIELPVYRCLRGTNNLGKAVALSLGLGLALIFFFSEMSSLDIALTLVRGLRWLSALAPC